MARKVAYPKKSGCAGGACATKKDSNDEKKHGTVLSEGGTEVPNYCRACTVYVHGHVRIHVHDHVHIHTRCEVMLFK